MIAAVGASNIYHWLVDVLPRVELLRAANVEIPLLDGIYVNELTLPFQWETLALLGVRRDQLIFCSPRTFDAPEILLVPSGFTLSDKPRWALEFLRRELPAAAEHREPGTTGPRRLHLSRQHAAGRRVTNGAQMRRALRSRGFRSVCLEELPFWRQVQLARSAEVIVAEHGGGLAHTIFSDAGTSVVDIMCPGWPVVVYWQIAGRLGLRYHHVMGRRGGLPRLFARLNLYLDFRVDVDKLCRLLDLCAPAPG